MYMGYVLSAENHVKRDVSDLSHQVTVITLVEYYSKQLGNCVVFEMLEPQDMKDVRNLVHIYPFQHGKLYLQLNAQHCS